MSKKVIHTGKILKKIDNNKYIIEVNPMSTCSSCSQNSFCHSFGDDKSKKFVVEADSEFDVNREVVLSITQKSLFLSVFIVYILPVVLILIASLITNFIFESDVITAAVSILVLIIYFINLKIFRKENIKVNIERYL